MDETPFYQYALALRQKTAERAARARLFVEYARQAHDRLQVIQARLARPEAPRQLEDWPSRG
jgi:hypothetical protein